MDQPLAGFIRALRGAGANVSTAEAIDAARTLALIGYDDRETLKTSFATVLAKSEDDRAIHDRMFDLFFAAAPAPEEDKQTAQRQADEGGGAASDESGDADQAETDAFTELATSGDANRIDLAIQNAANQIGADNIRFSTQSSWYTRRILETLGVEQMEERLIRHLQAHTPEDEAEAKKLMDARASMQSKAREFVDHNFEVFGAAATEAFMDEAVANKHLSALDQRDLERMRAIVAKMAKRLAERHARKRRRQKRGQLALAKTLRANAGNDGAPFNLVWKHKKKNRPKIVAVCDVSGSVARYVRFLLMFLYALDRETADLECYAFSARLEDVGPAFEGRGFEDAMNAIVARIGQGSTDYGQALEDLRELAWDGIDRRTTVLILGDGRSNDADPRLDLFRELAARCRRIIWLCPEHKGMWGSGDSCMLDYQPHCARVTVCTNAIDLEREIDDLLALGA